MVHYICYFFQIIINCLKKQNHHKSTRMSYYRAQIQYYYGYSRKSFPDNSNPKYSAKQPYHMISLQNLGKYTSLLEKYEFLFGSITLKCGQSKQLSPLFKFILRCQIAFDFVTPSLMRNYYKNLLDELKTTIDLELDTTNIELLSSFIEIAKRQESHKKLQAIAKEIGLQIKGSLKFPRYIKIMAYDKLVHQYTVLCQEEFKKIQKDDYEKVYGSRCILSPEMLITQAKKIDLLRKDVILNKLKILQKKYNSFYGCNVMSDGSMKSTFIIKINNLFRQNEPILQTIESMVQMRSDQINYRLQSQDIILIMWKQFRRYNNIIKNNYRSHYKEFYHHISPKNAIFNQSSLAVKLHYNPFLYETLGLAKKPCTVMTRLAFFPTPKSFNYYRSLPQVENPCIKRMLQDPFFGNKDFVQQKSSQKIEEQQCKKQIDESLSFREEQSIYKFILTSYFILNSKQYGRPFQISAHPQNQQRFLNELQNLKKELKNNFSNLQNYVGVSNKKAQNIQFSFDMRSLQQYFVHCQNEEDSLIKSLKFKKLQKFFNLRYLLINELNAIMMDDNIFYKMLNAKRYIIVYLIAVDQYLAELQAINDIEQDKYDQRKQLKEYLSKSITKKKFIFKKASLSAIEALPQIYVRIQQYSTRHENQKQSLYLNHDVNGKKMLSFIKDFETVKSVLTSVQSQIVKLQVTIRDGSYRQKYLQLLNIANQLIQSNRGKYRTILKSFVSHQMKPYTKILHKYPQKYQKDTPQHVKQYYNLINQKFELLVQSYQTVNLQNNSLLYQISVVPLFRIVEGKAYNEERMTPENNAIDKINFKNIQQICKIYSEEKNRKRQKKSSNINIDFSANADNNSSNNQISVDFLKINIQQRIKDIIQGRYVRPEIKGEKMINEKQSDSQSD